MRDNPIIVALDVESAEQARALVSRAGGAVDFYKVGMELYAAAGMGFVRELIDSGKKVFLDLKFYDIGETVKRAVAQVAQSGVSMLTVHAQSAVMRAAVEGRGDSGLKILGVTVLTSFDQEDLDRDGYRSMAVPELVALRAANAVASGVDGLVCSPLEVLNVRQIVGPEKVLVVPGVRSAGSVTGDQKRVATPSEALRNGANYLVMGRQIVRAADPVKAIGDVMQEIAAFL